MSKLKECKTCNKEVSKSAKKCPNCGAKLKHPIRNILVVFFVLFIISAALNSLNSEEVTSSSNNTEPDITYKIGDMIKTQKLEINITKAGTSYYLGDDWFNCRPSEGGVYITIKWNYKNIGSKPINMWSQPTIFLLSPDSTKYSQDVGASSCYATQINIDEKVISNLNPGLKVTSAAVFEVSSELIKKDGWQILIDADKNIYLPLTF